MDESERQLKLLGVLVSSRLVNNNWHWGALRGGYYINVRKSTVPDIGGRYQWDVGLYGNLSALSRDGGGSSLDDCVRQAHLAIAHYLREVEEVHEFVLCVESPPEVTSRYRREPVI